MFVVSLLINNVEDNEKVYETVMDFYNWYIDAIHQLSDKEYQPYIEYNDTNKTYNLKIESYCQNLRKHHCSENFIQREFLSYKQCAENLQKDYQISFEDISDYENIGCGFLFNYRWLNEDQEVVDGVKIIEMKSIKKNYLLVLCKFYIVDNQNKETIYQDYICYVTIIKINREYKIDNIEFK